MRRFYAMCLLAALPLFGGCAMFNRTEVQEHNTTTIGQQLIDLQSAKDKGAITEQEYNDLKKRIMDRKH